MVSDILLLGNPLLYQSSDEVREEELQGLKPVIDNLHDTLMDFRQKFGAGRAISAPQIGVMKRIIYMHIDKPMLLINPSLHNLSKEMIQLWDDCMSFPDLFVRVARHKRCTVRFRDPAWNLSELDLEDALSELLQHEHDHLEGILAVSRAIDGKSFALRSEIGPIQILR
ncbi:MAG: peptide deformylase [Candidatus Thorarchaeota archaeon]|nr:peptide deformylase [Candidatus Thorarchaeota archaeon]